MSSSKNICQTLGLKNTEAQKKVLQLHRALEQLKVTGNARYASEIRDLSSQLNNLDTIWNEYRGAVENLFNEWITQINVEDTNPFQFHELGLVIEDTGRVRLNNTKTIGIPDPDTYIPSLIQYVKNIDINGNSLGNIEEAGIVNAHADKEHLQDFIAHKLKKVKKLNLYNYIHVSLPELREGAQNSTISGADTISLPKFTSGGLTVRSPEAHLHLPSYNNNLSSFMHLTARTIDIPGTDQLGNVTIEQSETATLGCKQVNRLTIQGPCKHLVLPCLESCSQSMQLFDIERVSLPMAEHLRAPEVSLLSNLRITAPKLTEINARKIALSGISGDLRQYFPNLAILGEGAQTVILVRPEIYDQIIILINEGTLEVRGTLAQTTEHPGWRYADITRIGYDHAQRISNSEIMAVNMAGLAIFAAASEAIIDGKKLSKVSIPGEENFHTSSSEQAQLCYFNDQTKLSSIQINWHDVKGRHSNQSYYTSSLLLNEPNVNDYLRRDLQKDDVVYCIIEGKEYMVPRPELSFAHLINEWHLESSYDGPLTPSLMEELCALEDALMSYQPDMGKMREYLSTGLSEDTVRSHYANIHSDLEKAINEHYREDEALKERNKLLKLLDILGEVRS